MIYTKVDLSSTLGETLHNRMLIAGEWKESYWGWRESQVTQSLH